MTANPDEDGGFSLWGVDGVTFGDHIDVVNPLHHFPGVSTLYHYFTDDDIGFARKLAGDMLFGGVVGLASSVFGQLLKETTGHTLGGHAITFFLGPSEGADEKPIRIAEFFEPGAGHVSPPGEAALIPHAPTHVAVLRSYRPGTPWNGGSPAGPAPGISVAGNAVAATETTRPACWRDRVGGGRGNGARRALRLWPAGKRGGASEDWRLAYAAQRPVAVLRSPRPATAPTPRETTATAEPAAPSRDLAEAGRDAVFARTGFVSASPIFTAPRPQAVLRRPHPAVAPVAAVLPSSTSEPSSAPGRAAFQPAAFYPATPPVRLKASEPGPWIAREMMRNLDLYRRVSQPPVSRHPTLDRRE